MRLVLLAIFLFSSLFDVCLTSEISLSQSSAIATLSSELSEASGDGCCDVKSNPSTDESQGADSQCAHCASCHFWNYPFVVQFALLPCVEKAIHPCEFSFKSRPLESLKRPPKTLA